MKVELLNYTKDGDKLIAQAAKLCYSEAGLKEINENLSPEEVDRFVHMLTSLGHMSPMEHISFSFYVEGISRACSHQLVRHRLASYSQQSQRYVRLDDFDYVIPPAIEKNPRAREVFIEAIKRDREAYEDLVQALMEEGMKDKDLTDKEKNALEKRAIEDARYVFPNACATKVMVTMNLRSLLHFFEMRTCLRAQWEIRTLAIEMLKEVKKVYPLLFQDAGPGCLRGPCPEGKMTCGKIKEVRAYFQGGQDDWRLYFWP